MKFLTVQFSLVSYYFLSARLKYFLSVLLLTTLNVCFLSHFFQRLCQSLKPCVTARNMWMCVVTIRECIIANIEFCNMLVLCRAELLATCPSCKLSEHTFLPVCGC